LHLCDVKGKQPQQQQNKKLKIQDHENAKQPTAKQLRKSKQYRFITGNKGNRGQQLQHPFPQT